LHGRWIKRFGPFVSSIARYKKLTKTFEQQVLDLLPRLRRFAIGLAGSASDGDDLCQMTIERALTRRQQWQEGTRLDSWMYRIMRNIFIDERRAGARRGQTFVDEEAGLSIGADGAQEASVELTMVDRAMSKLPDDQREAVLLVMVEGYSYKEAADIAGCPVGTLNSRLVRGRDALVTMLEEDA
jgi:RNA polymerase sigma-70 factor (ECF subfamily)